MQKEILYFDFRVIDTEDGNQVIRRDLKTPMDSLTPVQQMEYMQIHNSLVISDAMEKRKRTEEARHNTIGYRFKMMLSAALA